MAESTENTTTHKCGHLISTYYNRCPYCGEDNPDYVPPKSNMELTDESFSFSAKDIFHFTGGDYKPWWCARNEGKMYVSGYCGCNPSCLLDELDAATEDGRITMKDNRGMTQNYLIEVTVKVTKLKDLR